MTDHWLAGVGRVQEPASLHDGQSFDAGAPQPSGQVGTAIMGGLIAWAEPDYGVDYLATRFPVGTLVRLCSFNGCIVRRTNDFGPVGRAKIADLAVLDWEQITGLPRDRGVAQGTIEVVEHIELPATDTSREDTR